MEQIYGAEKYVCLILNTKLWTHQLEVRNTEWMLNKEAINIGYAPKRCEQTLATKQRANIFLLI